MSVKHLFKRPKKKFILILLPLIILGVIFWPKPPKSIETQKVISGDIVESLSATGTIDSVSSVNLNFLAGGKLVYLGAKRGDIVEAGQVIASLDQRTTQKNLETALRNYALQRNAFEQTQDDHNDHTPQNAINDEMKRILENNQYDLDKATLSVELQQLAREQSVLTTPIGGVVTRSDVSTAGLNVGPTTTFSIADPMHLVFKIDVDEADIGKVRDGQSVEVSFDAYPDHPVDLNISYIDFSSHTSGNGATVYTVEAAMPDNDESKYRIGMHGDAEIFLARKSDVTTVSLASITDDSSVYIKTGNYYTKKKVITGIQSDIEVEVISGLKEGDEVALQPDEAAELVKPEKKKFLFF